MREGNRQPASSSAPLAAVVLAFALTPVAIGAPSRALEQGLELFHQARFERAEPLLLQGLEEDPGNFQGQLAAAELYLGWSDWQRAIPAARRAVELEPGSSTAHLRLAQGLGLEALGGSAVRALFGGREIRRELEAAIALDPSSVEARTGLIQFHLRAPSLAGGSLGRALAEAEAIVKLDPVAGHRSLARVLAEQGREAEALAAIERLAARDRGQARLARAHFFSHSLGDDSRAAAELMRLGAEEPGDADDLATGAEMLIALGRPTDALRLLDLALVADPEHLLANYQIGRATVLSGQQLPRAETALRKYLSIESRPQAPSHASAHWWLGRAYEAMGRTAEARQEYEQAVSWEPGNPEYRRALRRLRRRLGSSLGSGHRTGARLLLGPPDITLR